MSKLNKKYYDILNGLRDHTLFAKDVSHEDLIALLDCGFIMQENFNIITGKGILALDEYRSDKGEKIKSYIILFASIISCAASLFSCFRR